MHGSPGRTRTCNLVVNSHPLCQLSYRGTKNGRGNYNPPPVPRQADYAAMPFRPTGRVGSPAMAHLSNPPWRTRILSNPLLIMIRARPALVASPETPRDYRRRAGVFRKVIHPEIPRRTSPARKGRREKSEGMPAPYRIFFHSRM